MTILANLLGCQGIDEFRTMIPHMREQGGRIIQIFSYGGQVAYPGNSLYHASKFGIEGFVESVVQEVAPFNIQATIIEPGMAITENAMNYHEKMFPGYKSDFIRTDPNLLRLLITLPLTKWSTTTTLMTGLAS